MAVTFAQLPGQAVIELDVSEADADLTAADGPTGGYCARQLYVNESGSVAFRDLSGNDSTIEVVAPVLLPFPVQKVYASGTDADGIFAIL